MAGEILRVMLRRLYTILTYTALPFALARFMWRAKSYGVGKRACCDRLGYINLTSQDPCLWIHAVSLGETITATPLILALRARYPDHHILVTHMTATGHQQSKQAFAHDKHITTAYVPYDIPGAIKRFLRCVQPRIAIMMETEWWPNCFEYCRRLGIPLMVANGRLSESSQRRYQRIARFTRELLQSIACYAAQSEADGARVVALGLPPERLQVLGNLKFDRPLDESRLSAGHLLRNQLGMKRPVWIAGSTHEGEEVSVLEAHRIICQHLPDAILILVPRHPERFDTVFRLIQKEGWSVIRRSEKRALFGMAEAVFLGDTMGELMVFYVASDVAFVGGSLVPVGGHNLLEPAQLKKPVLSGPHLHHFVAVRQLLVEADALTIVQDATHLAERVVAQLKDATMRKAIGERAAGVVHAHQGAVQKHVACIAALLESV